MDVSHLMFVPALFMGLAWVGAIVADRRVPRRSEHD